MAKFIIDNRSSASDFSMLALVMEVVVKGKISKNGTQYCYITTMTTRRGEYVVYAERNPKSFKFTVTDG